MVVIPRKPYDGFKIDVHNVIFQTVKICYIFWAHFLRKKNNKDGTVTMKLNAKPLNEITKEYGNKYMKNWREWQNDRLLVAECNYKKKGNGKVKNYYRMAK